MITYKQEQTVDKQRRCTERQKEETAKKEQMHKYIKQYIFWANLDFRVRGQKADCDGRTDKEVYTNSCDLWK